MVRTSKTVTKFSAIAGLLLGVAPLGVMAAGLGKLNVLSGLGQPLRAEIEIVSPERDEVDSLAPRIATPDAFRAAGIDYGLVVPRVRTVLERRGERYFVVLTTTQPVEEPFLDLLVELNWSAGRLVRQYTFLLDPSEYRGPTAIAAAPSQPGAEVSAVQAPSQPSLLTTTPAAPFAPAPVAQEPVVSPPSAQTSAPIVQAPAAEPSQAGSAAGEYEVRRGDTLSKIAQQYKSDGVTAQQMLVALYRANEDAFINRNMNLVLAGRVLQIPDATSAEAVAPLDANRIVAAQTRDFNEYKNRLAASVAAASTSEGASQQRTAGRITDAAEETRLAKAAPSDQLRVTKATDTATGGRAAATARSDDLAARERALREANDRVAELERNVGELQKLLEMKNQQLAELQRQAQAVTTAPEPPRPAEITTPPVAPAEPPPAVRPPDASNAPTADTPAAAALPVERPAVQDAPKAPPVTDAPKAPRRPAPPPPPEPSLLETFLDEPLYPAGMGGGLLALLVAGYLWRRKKSAARLESSLLTTTDSSSVFGTTGGRSIDTGGSSIQTDFSQGGIGTIDTDEVDPVAEADVYMAYGRDAQAEEILKEALQKDPNRQAVRVKLLEIYAARKDLKAFETTAGEIYAATGGQGPEWQKAAELGMQTDPTNPLYGGKNIAVNSLPAEAFAAAAAAGGAAGGAMAAAPASSESFDLAAKVPSIEPSSIDFDLDANTAKAGNAQPDMALGIASQSPGDLGFDLNLGEDKPSEEASDFSPSGTFIMDAATKKAVSDMVQAQNAAGRLAIDFELPTPSESFDQSASVRSSGAFDFKLDEASSKQPAGPVDLSGISFDLGSSGIHSAAPVDAQWQEVATKLDLAKAYEEMGDRDGARELLNEVVKEGDAAQQQQAKQMLEMLR